MSRAIHQERVMFFVSPFSGDHLWFVADALVLTKVLHEATSCIIIWYTCWLLSQYYVLSQESRSSNATSGNHQPSEQKLTLSPCERVRHQRLGRWWWPHLVSKYSSRSISHIHPGWLLNSNLSTSAFSCMTQFWRFLDNQRFSSFRQF